MKNLFLIILSIVLSGLSACMNLSQEEPSGQSTPLHYSSSYEPPYFEDNERTQKIGKALTGSHQYYSDAADNHHLPGIAYGVVVDDSLVFFGGQGDCNIETGARVTERSLFRIASMSKSFTAMAILKLRDEGRLSLSDPAWHYIPELEDLNYLSSDATQVSIFNLLTMTAGFPEDNPWGDRFLDISDDDLMNQVEKGISFSTVPSLHYEYSNLGYGLLGQIISTVSGISYQEYISQNILYPLGMMDTYWEYSKAPGELLAMGYRWEDGHWVPEPLLHDGAFGAMGGLITSILDFSKYISFHLSAWPPRSDPETGPLKRSSLREMHRMNNPRYYTDAHRFGDNKIPIMRGYGYGLVSMMDHKGIVEVGHNGGLPGFGSSYMFYPQYGIGIMAFSNLTYVGGTVRTANYKLIKELIKKDLFIPRVLPVSNILEEKKEQVLQLIINWDPVLEKDIVAANLYLDISRDRRMDEAGKLLNQIGEIRESGPVIPENQLRGSFIIKGANQNMQVYFTLTPEAEPKVQWLSLELVPGE